MAEVALGEFLNRLKEARESEKSGFLQRLLEHAIMKVERRIQTSGKRPAGSLTRVPKPTAKMIDDAIALRDLGKILSIRDARGSHGSNDENLALFLTEYYRDNPDSSTRQISKEAKKRGLRAHRGRIEKLRAMLQLGQGEPDQRQKRISGLNFIDLSFLHIQAQVTVMGFETQGRKNWCHRIGTLKNDRAPSPLVGPTSADRSRLALFSELLIEKKAGLLDQYPDWQRLLDDLGKVGSKMDLVHVSSLVPLPPTVSDKLNAISSAVASCERDTLLKELMRPSLLFMGAGFLPTLANTVEQLEGVTPDGASSFICQPAEARRDALYLRTRLQEELALKGLLVNVGDRQAYRLGSSTQIRNGTASTSFQSCFVVPSPIDLPLFTLEPPADNETIQLDFHGADVLLARSRVDEMVGVLNRAIALQRSFSSGREPEPMLKCAEFFCHPSSRLSAIRKTMGRRPDFRKMTPEVRTIWAAYVLTMFDPDILESNIDETTTYKEVPFLKSLEEFRHCGALWIEEWRGKTLSAFTRKDTIPHVVEEALGGAVIAAEQRLSRVWKFGMDEAARRMANCIERAGRDKLYGTDWKKNSSMVITRLAKYFEGVWPTVWVSRKYLLGYAKGVFESTLSDLRERQKAHSTFEEVSVSDSDPASNSDDDSDRAIGKKNKMVMARPSVTSRVEDPKETPEMVVRERLENPFAVEDDGQLAEWYVRLLAATRRALERGPQAQLLPPGMLPLEIVILLQKAVQRAMTGGNFTSVGKSLRAALEGFFEKY